MASSIQLLRSTISQERPFPGNLLEGQPAVNLNSTEPGLFFKAADGSLVKFGPAAITSDGSPPNSSPQGSSGNTVGELWLDKSTNPAVLKVYDGTDWIDAGSGGGGGAGSFVRWIYTAIGGETSLSGSSGGVLLDYTPGLEEVFVNGVLITRGTDYSAINGSSITNLSPLTAGDVVTVTSMNPLETVQLPGQVTLLRWTVLASAGQTVLSGIDSSSQQLAYTAGFEEVYVNGAFLRRGLDYTATNGSSITLTASLALDDEVTVMAWSPLTVANQISSSLVSFNQGGVGSTSRSVESRLKDTVSVKDFGAVGNGLVDDTQAIQDAINASFGKKLFFPGGTYLFKKELVFKNNYVEGVPGYSVLKAANWDVASGYSQCVKIDPVSGFDNANASVYGLTLDVTNYSSANATSFNVAGLWTINGDRVLMKQCQILGEGTYKHGTSLKAQRVREITLEDCTFRDLRANVLWLATAGAGRQGNKKLVKGCRIINVPRNPDAPANRAVITGDDDEFIFVNNYVENTESLSTGPGDGIYASVAAIDCGNSRNVVIANNVFKDVAVGTNFESSSGVSSQVIVANNTFEGKGAHVGIWVNWTTFARTFPLVITGNTCSNFTAGIGITHADNLVVSNNVVSDNAKTGISLDSSTNFSCTGNTVAYNNSPLPITLDAGIAIKNCSDGILSGNQVQDIAWPSGKFFYNSNTDVTEQEGSGASSIVVTHPDVNSGGTVSYGFTVPASGDYEVSIITVNGDGNHQLSSRWRAVTIDSGVFKINATELIGTLFSAGSVSFINPTLTADDTLTITYTAEAQQTQVTPFNAKSYISWRKLASY